MLEELHFAINKYHSDDIEQKIVHLKPHPNGSKPKHFALDSQLVLPGELRAHLKSSATNPVLLCHKLFATDYKPLCSQLFDRVPLLVLNHTQSSNVKGIGPTNGIISVSRNMLKTMSSLFPKQKTYYIRNGVNQCRYQSIEPRKPESVKNYLVTGRMNNFNDCKHPKDWIPFLSGMRLSKPLWHDYLGAGIHLKTAEKQLRVSDSKNLRNRINLAGRIDSFEEKVSYLKRWNLFFYEIPGVEGTSMSLLEALACGIPAVINNKPGNNEIIQNGVNGRVYQDRTSAILFLEKMCQDEGALKRLSQSTREHFAKNLDAKHAARQYVQLIKQVSDGQ